MGENLFKGLEKAEGNHCALILDQMRWTGEIPSGDLLWAWAGEC